MALILWHMECHQRRVNCSKVQFYVRRECSSVYGVWGSHGGAGGGYATVVGRVVPTFRRIVMPSCSWQSSSLRVFKLSQRRIWAFCPCGVRRRVTGWLMPDVSGQRGGHLSLEDGTIMLSWNIGHRSPSHAARYPRRTEVQFAFVVGCLVLKTLLTFESSGSRELYAHRTSVTAQKT